MNNVDNDNVQYIGFVCEWCKQPFTRLKRYVKSETNKGKHIRFCSKKCRDADHGKDRKIFKCACCGKDFIKNPRQSGVCCSPECSKLLHENNSVTRECEYCGKKFSRKKSHMDLDNAHAPGKYCSKQCAYNARSKFRTVERKCKECGNTFKCKENKSQAFCNSTCKKKWNEKQRVYLVCEQCGKEFSVTQSRYKTYKTKYCCNDCRLKAIKIKKDTYAKVSHALRTSRQYQVWRNKVLCVADYTCQECGSNNGIMHAHHIKELYKICLEQKFNIDVIMNSDIFNDINNGQCLCESCHQKKHYQLHGETRNPNGQFCRLVAKELEDEIIRAELSGKAKPEKAC